MVATPAQDKYFLRSLHQEIDLFDRKLAHMLRYDSFESEAERKASAGKLVAKRETLAKAARKLVEDGIEFKSSELPRSFRTDEDSPAAETQVVGISPSQEPMVLKSVRTDRPLPSPYAGTILDVQADIQAYKKNRGKAVRSQA